MNLFLSIVYIVLISIPGKEALTRNETLQVILPQVRKQYLRIGVDVRLVKYIRTRNNPAAFLPSDPCDRYWWWVSYIQRSYPQLQGRLVHLIVPPKIVNGERYGCGTALGGCYRTQKWPISYSTGVRPLSSIGNGYKWTVKIMTHELGHNFSAEHVSTNKCAATPTIMCPGILPEPLQWAYESVKQIKTCIK